MGERLDERHIGYFHGYSTNALRPLMQAGASAGLLEECSIGIAWTGLMVWLIGTKENEDRTPEQFLDLVRQAVESECDDFGGGVQALVDWLHADGDGGG